MPITLSCLICEKQFKVSPARKNTAKYCSKECYWKSKEKKVKRICENCGCTFEVWPSVFKFREAKYCSPKCYGETNSKSVIKNCLVCGKEFKVELYKIRNDRGKYCSQKCAHNARKTKIKGKCEHCGKTIYSYPSKLKIGKDKFCSKTCYNKELSKRMKGENHPGWKGGIRFGPYCPKFNDEFKERVRTFWNRKCGICGKDESRNSRRLPVHHVNYEKRACCDDTPPLFIPLCDNCHSKTNWNREYWESIFTEYIMIWFDGESYIPLEKVK